MANWIDLTHRLGGDTVPYPGDPDPVIDVIASIGEDGYANSMLMTGLHTGTHMDAPAHIIPGGKELWKYPPGRFSGPAAVVDARERKGSSLDIPEGDAQILVVCTGWYHRFGGEEYFTDFPVISRADAEEIVKRGIEMVCLDTPGPDGAPFEIHQILLSNDILIVENLAHTDLIVSQKSVEVYAFPLLIQADSAPCRILARI